MTKKRGNRRRPSEDKILPPPDKGEAQAIHAAITRVNARPRRLTTLLENPEDGESLQIGPEHSDRAGWLVRLEDLFGTNGRHFPLSQLNQLLSLARKADGTYDGIKANSLIAAVEGAKPENELQAMLAVQMIAANEMAMQAARRATRVDQIPQYDSAGTMAVKLMRAYAGHLELLDKLQRGGQQTVRVEHVHVHSGAQAIVGNVGTRGGRSDEITNQPHAKGELPAPGAGPMPEVRGKDTEREPLPIACCEGEKPLPYARRGFRKRGA